MATAAERRSKPVNKPKQVCEELVLCQGHAVKEGLKLGCFYREVIAHEEQEGRVKV